MRTPRPTAHQRSVLRALVDERPETFPELQRLGGVSRATVASAIAGLPVHPVILEKLLDAAERLRRGAPISSEVAA